MDYSFVEEHYVRRPYQDLSNRATTGVDAMDEPSKRGQRLPCVTNLLKTMPFNSLILDIGCGGNLACQEGCLTIGVDICMPPSVEGGAKGGDIVLADMLHLPFRENVFDCVLLVSILHHVPVEQRRVECLQNCLSLAKMPNLFVVVWAKEQQSAKFPANDVIVPYNLEDLCRQGHIANIPFNKYSTREQRIIMNSLPISIAHPFLRICCQQYLPKRVQKRLLEMATRLASICPLFVSLDFYEDHFQNALNFVIDRIGDFKAIQNGNNSAGRHQQQQNSSSPSMGILLKKFALRLSQSIFDEAFGHLRTLHREVLKYRYYHVFQRGELERLFAQIRATAQPGREFYTLKCDYEYGNWYIHVGP